MAGPRPITLNSGAAAELYDRQSDQWLVAVHGVMDRSGGFRRLLRHLPSHSAIALDRRGYGASLHVQRHLGFEDDLEDIGQAIAHARREGRRVTVVGHSYGALLASHCVNRDDCDAILLWEPPAPWLPEFASSRDELLAKRPSEAAEALIRRTMGDRLWERMPPASRRARLAEGYAVFDDLRQSARTEIVPTRCVGESNPVVAYGNQTIERFRRAAHEVARILDARIATIPGDHAIHLSAPKDFASLIELSEQAAPS